MKLTFLCLPPTLSSPCSPPDWLLTGSCCSRPTFIPRHLLSSCPFSRQGPSSAPPPLIISFYTPLISSSSSSHPFLIYFDLIYSFLLPLPSSCPLLSFTSFFFPHSSDPLVFPPLPYSFSFPLVFPSLLWRLNLSLSSECPWAEGGYCWCRSRRSFWGADNSPAMLPLSSCACFTWQTVYFSSIFNFFKLRTVRYVKTFGSQTVYK